MIQEVENSYDLAGNHCGYKITYPDGIIALVPLDEGNRHYQKIMDWVAEGNEIFEPS
jgi:hypothetical protein